jgi:hypothetical protein
VIVTLSQPYLTVYGPLIFCPIQKKSSAIERSSLILLSAPNCSLQTLDETRVLTWLMSMGSTLVYIIVPSKDIIHARRSPTPSRILHSSPIIQLEVLITRTSIESRCTVGLGSGHAGTTQSSNALCRFRLCSLGTGGTSDRADMAQ